MDGEEYFDAAYGGKTEAAQQFLIAQHVADVLNSAGPNENSPDLAESLMTLVQEERAARLLERIKAANLLVVDGGLFMGIIGCLEEAMAHVAKWNEPALYNQMNMVLTACLEKGHIKYEQN